MIATLAVLAMAQAAGVASGQVSGVVRSADTGRPVANAHVFVVGGLASTLADSGGRYELRLAPRRYSLRFEATGHVPLTLAVVVTEGVDQSVDVDLAPSVTQLAPLVVRARRSSTVDTPGDFGADSLGPTWARLALPGVDNLESMLADAPGGARRGPDGGTLHFQGGDADQYLVRLDGFPLLSASHFSPASSAVNSDLIRGATIRMGAPPAREGGWLSGTVDLTSSLAAADDLQLRGAVTSTDLRQLAMGPLLGSDSRFLLSGRRSFRNVLGDPGAGESPNGYEDWLASAGGRVGHGWSQVLAFRNRNQFAFPSRVEGGAADDGHDVGPPPADPNAVEWSATTVGASWQGNWQGTAVTARAWTASTGATVDWRSETSPVQLDSRFVQHGVQVDGARAAGGGWLGFGAGWIRDASSYGAGSLGAPAPTLRVAIGTDQAVGYVEANLPVGPWLRTRVGARATLLDWRRVAIDPRIGLELRPLAPVRLRLTAGRVHQFVQSLRNQESFLSNFMGFELPAAVGAAGGPAARADNLSFDAEARLGGGLTVGVEGYRRWLAGLLLVAPSTGQLFGASSSGTGTGEAAGIEVRSSYVGRRFGFEVSYAVGSSRRRLGDVAYVPGFQRSNRLTIRAAGKADGTTTVSLALQALGGQRTSLIRPLDWEPYDALTGEGEFLGTPDPLDPALNGRLLPGTACLAVAVRREWRLGSGGELTTSVALENLLNRSNPVALSLGDQGIRSISSTPRALRFEVAWRF